MRIDQLARSQVASFVEKRLAEGNSPRTVNLDIIMLRNVLKRALDAGFHDLRHHFASICVMAGIDFMTVAAWLGHKDGGILVGKVYGH